MTRKYINFAASNEARDAAENLEKSQRFFEPENMAEILAMPFRNKTLGKYKGAVLLTRYILNKCYVCQYFKDEFKKAPMSTFAASRICNGDKHVFVTLRKWLIDNKLIVSHGKARVGAAALKYTLGPAFDGVAWKKPAETYTLTLPKPMKRTEKEVAETKVNITVDVPLLEASLDKVGEKRKWKEGAAEVWHWFLTDDWDRYYTETEAGRHYGKWARCPRELRGVFLIDGEECVEPDLPSSHPTLLSGFYDVSGDTEEKGRYDALISSGGFYAAVMEFGKLDRDAAKGMVMEFLGGCWNDGKVGIVKEFYRKNFPLLFGIISTLRQNTSYKELNKRLQKVEAGVICESICNEFQAVSLHDGVLCKKSDAEAVAARMAEEVFRVTGVRVNVKIEDKREELKNLIKTE